MSVIINNMAMPQNCYECRFCETYLGHHLCAAFLNYIEDPRSGRLDTCPLEEQKHGQWIKMSDADGVYWACSECGEDIPRISHYNPQFDLFPRLESIEKTRYCPNCGAKMDEVEE